MQELKLLVLTNKRKRNISMNAGVEMTIMLVLTAALPSRSTSFCFEHNLHFASSHRFEYWFHPTYQMLSFNGRSIDMYSTSCGFGNRPSPWDIEVPCTASSKSNKQTFPVAHKTINACCGFCPSVRFVPKAIRHGLAIEKQILSTHATAATWSLLQLEVRSWRFSFSNHPLLSKSLTSRCYARFKSYMTEYALA